MATTSGKQRPTQRRLLYPGGCREHLRKALAREFEEITAGFVEAAKSGSVPHVKLAAELLKPTRKATTRKKSTAARLLKEWAEKKKQKAGEPRVEEGASARVDILKDC